MSSGGRIDRMLDSIPGYGGYRDKERRRDSDRVIREKLALDYGQIADRLGRLATALADERKIAAISVVDKPYKRLNAFIDRVRTAAYGYAPLFSENTVDEHALDQVALFDNALADQQEALAAKVGELERTSPDDAAFKTVAGEIVAIVDGLHERFDKRHEVIHAGKALPEKDITSYLEPARPAGPPAVYRLHEHEAVSYDGVNYSVAGRVTVESPDESWRAFQLKGGSDDAWLVVSNDSARQPLWMQRVALEGNVGDDTVSASGSTYNRDKIVRGKGEVIGISGAAADQPVEFGHYRAATGDEHLFAFDWGTGTIALRGVEANPTSLDIYTRER
jgi:hypothetical protein